VEGGRCPRRVAARLIVSAGRCLAAVIALSEASGWRLVGSTLLADVLETLRLGATPLVNAWKLPMKGSDDAAADDDVAEYLGLCAQVCDAASSFITTSSSSSAKKSGAAPAASHARAVLKLQVIAYSCLCASHSQSAASRTTAKFAILICSTSISKPFTHVFIPTLYLCVFVSSHHLVAAPPQGNRRHFANTYHLFYTTSRRESNVALGLQPRFACKKTLRLSGQGGCGSSQAAEAEEGNDGCSLCRG
jgi:hypothetical protein